MKSYEVLKLPVQGFKESPTTPLERLALIPAHSYREACQTFTRLNAWLSSTTIWRVREVNYAS